MPLLWLWYGTAAAPDAPALAWLRDRVLERMPPDSRSSFAARWAHSIPFEERAWFGLRASPEAAPRADGSGEMAKPTPGAARGISPPPLPLSPGVAPRPDLVRAARSAREDQGQMADGRTPAPAAPPAPSVWEQHVQPFFAANWPSASPCVPGGVCMTWVKATHFWAASHFRCDARTTLCSPPRSCWQRSTWRCGSRHGIWGLTGVRGASAWKRPWRCC